MLPELPEADPEAAPEGAPEPELEPPELESLEVEPLPLAPVPLAPYFCTQSWRSVPVMPMHLLGRFAVSAEVPVLAEVPLPDVPLPPAP